MKKNIKCLIVDDEPLAIELIQDHIAKLPYLELAGSCQNALEAFEILKKEPIDLVFLDIQMPMITGMEFVRSLQNPPGIIFTTAYRQYAVESYELNVIDYLLKPITFARFLKAIDKYLGTVKPSSAPVPQVAPETSPEDHLFVNANKKHVKVRFEEILYVESLKDYIRIHTEEQKITTKEKIGDFADKLPAHFLRIHRSFIVNRAKITAFTAHDVEIGEREIPIGGSYKQWVLEVLKES